MNILVDWDDRYDHQVIRYTFEPGWRWDEVAGAFSRASGLLDTVDRKVDIIMDFSKSGFNVPIGAISHAQRAFSNPRHPNVGFTVMIGNRFITALTDTVRKLLRDTAQKWEILFVTDLNAAYEAIDKRQQRNDSEHAST